MITLKGFPTEISGYIDLPDIGELLLYPSFFDVDIDLAYKIGTEFQRYLIDKTNLKGTRKHISVLFQVRLLTPRMRSCTAFHGDTENEWHIDSEAYVDEKDKVYTEETDYVHLLTNNVSARTEFNKYETVLDIDSSLTYREFKDEFRRRYDEFHIVPEKMPSNRIVTFTNHLHRAIPSKSPEFKLMYRVVETDRERPPLNHYTPTQNLVEAYDYDRKAFVRNIERQNDKIIIYLPSIINQDMLWKKES